MKCPECTDEMVSLEIPFCKKCGNCKIIWLIQTLDQSYQMGMLNTELLSRNDLSTSEKTDILMKKVMELNKNDNR